MTSTTEKTAFTVVSDNDEASDHSLGSQSTSSDEEQSEYSDDDSFDGTTSDEEDITPVLNEAVVAAVEEKASKLKVPKVSKKGVKSQQSSPQASPKLKGKKSHLWANAKGVRRKPADVGTDNASECSSQEVDVEDDGTAEVSFIVWEGMTKTAGSAAVKLVKGVCSVVKDGKPVDATTFDGRQYFTSADDYSVVKVEQNGEVDVYRAVHCKPTNTYGVLVASNYDNEAVRIIMEKVTPVRKTVDICNFSLNPQGSPENPVLARYAEKFNVAAGGIIFSSRNAKTYIAKLEAAKTSKRKVVGEEQSTPSKKAKAEEPAKAPEDKKKKKKQPKVGSANRKDTAKTPEAEDEVVKATVSGPAPPHANMLSDLSKLAAQLADEHKSGEYGDFKTFSEAATFFEQAYKTAIFVADLPQHIVAGMFNTGS